MPIGYKKSGVYASYTNITEAGVKTVLAAAKARGRLAEFTIFWGKCRGVARPVRQAAEKGALELASALGL